MDWAFLRSDQVQYKPVTKVEKGVSEESMKNNLLIASGLLAALMSVKPADSQAQGWKKSNFIPYSEVGLGLGTSSY